jgi:hypothetical protein
MADFSVQRLYLFASQPNAGKGSVSMPRSDRGHRLNKMLSDMAIPKSHPVVDPAIDAITATPGRAQANKVQFQAGLR